MDSEKPRSLGSLITRTLCTFVVLFLLYVLGIGPVTFVWIVFPDSNLMFSTLYDPLTWATIRTPCLKPLETYRDWWSALGTDYAIKRFHRNQTPPEQP